MPEKSIREMSELEKKHYSLSARTFHAVLIFGIVLGIIAISIGFYLYRMSVETQYKDKAVSLAKTVTTLVGSEDVDKYTTKVMDIYNALPVNAKNDYNDDRYRQAFKSVEDDYYMELIALMNQLNTNNGTSQVFIGTVDAVNNRFVYVFNSDQMQTLREPGQWVDLEERYVKALEQAKSNEASILRGADKQYVCTGTCPIYNNDGKVIAYAIVAISMDEIAKLSRVFLYQYILVIAVATLILGYIMVQHLKRVVVKPINELADAANAYMEDRRNGEFSIERFKALDISTGDEIENLAWVMKDMEQDIIDYITNLTNVTAEKERISTELSLANRIQADMLPNIYPAFPERPEFDVYASMTPAKEVGGDFYDFYMIDDTHLALTMADVSGKGVPAALFMMASKILLQNYAMLGYTPSQILAMVNNQICSNNREDMFVTVWMGILDTTTGEVVASNAGHEFPALTEQGNFVLYHDRHGLVLGGMEDMVYRDYTIKLNPGDKLFVYTDGVVEATDTSQSLFGDQKMISALNKSVKGDPMDVLISLMEDINDFVGEADQFDDITMLCLQYNGHEEA